MVFFVTAKFNSCHVNVWMLYLSLKKRTSIIFVHGNHFYREASANPSIVTFITKTIIQKRKKIIFVLAFVAKAQKYGNPDCSIYYVVYGCSFT